MFAYQRSGSRDRLWQGEILSGVQEPQPEHPDGRISPDVPGIGFELVDHQRVVILTPDCDLLTDYSARTDPSPKDAAHQRQRQSRLLQHIQCCDVYEESAIRQARSLSSDLWRRVKRNQDERYHHIPAGEVAGEEGVQHPGFFLDFKRMFSIPTEFLYRSIEVGGVRRQGIIPSIWVHSLIHRYFAFHSRVGVPDPEDESR